MTNLLLHVPRIFVPSLVICASSLAAQTSAQSTVRQEGQPTAAAPAAKDRHAALRRVSLADGGRVWVGFAGQARERVEAWSDFNFGTVPPGTSKKTDDVFVLTRLLFSADLHLGSRVRAFAQGKSSLSTDRELVGGRRTSDVDELDAQQLFAEVRVFGNREDASALLLQGGRFEMSFGKQRFFSNLDWGNTRRAYEGVNAVHVIPGATITAFWAQPVQVRFYRPDRRDSSTRVFGVYGTTRRGNLGADLYWLGQHRDSGVVVWNGTPGRERRQTVGARFWGPARAPSSVDVEGEAAFQFGSMGSNGISARMLTAQAGYTWRAARRAPRVFLGFDYASGDDAPGGDVATFSQLNPQAHPHLGLADLVGRQNVVDWSAGTSAALARRLNATAEYHLLRRASAADAFYNKAGTVARAAAFGSSKSLGSDLDLTLRAPVDRYTLFMLGWSHFFPGEFVKQGTTRGAKAIDMAYAMLQYTM